MDKDYILSHVEELSDQDIVNAINEGILTLKQLSTQTGGAFGPKRKNTIRKMLADQKAGVTSIPTPSAPVAVPQSDVPVQSSVAVPPTPAVEMPQSYGVPQPAEPVPELQHPVMPQAAPVPPIPSVPNYQSEDTQIINESYDSQQPTQILQPMGGPQVPQNPFEPQAPYNNSDEVKYMGGEPSTGPSGPYTGGYTSPTEGMDMPKPYVYKSMFASPLSVNGRIGRLEFFVSLLIYDLVYAVLFVAMFKFLYDPFNPFAPITWTGICMLPMLYFYICQAAKRCHDLGHSAWMMLVPIFNPFFLLFAEGNRFENGYEN